MRLTPQQKRDIGRVLRVAKRQRASPREQLAAVMAILVENNGVDRTPGQAAGGDKGDRDSEGGFQQRPSQGWGPHSESLETDAAQFLRAAKKQNTGRGSAGQLAQRVQRSAFPGRYDQARGLATHAIRELTGGGAATRGRGAPARAASGAATPGMPVVPGVPPPPTVPEVEVDPVAKLDLVRQLTSGRTSAGDFAQQLLSLEAGADDQQAAQAEALQETYLRALQAAGLQGAFPGPQQPGMASVPGPRAPKGGGKTSPPSKRARYASGELKEMFYNGPGGVNVDNGKRVPKGYVDGHTSHVHVAAGPKRIRQIAKLAQKRGLTVRELEGFDKVDPVHTNGSFHYSNRAADISGGTPAQLAAFSREVARLFGVR